MPPLKAKGSVIESLNGEKWQGVCLDYLLDVAVKYFYHGDKIRWLNTMFHGIERSKDKYIYSSSSTGWQMPVMSSNSMPLDFEMPMQMHPGHLPQRPGIQNQLPPHDGIPKKVNLYRVEDMLCQSFRQLFCQRCKAYVARLIEIFENTK